MKVYAQATASLALLAASLFSVQALDAALADSYPSAAFIETFASGNAAFDKAAGGRWVKSQNSKYSGQAVEVKPISFEEEDLEDYQALTLENAGQ